MSKQSRERRALKRERQADRMQVKHAREELADTLEEMGEFAEECTGELKPLRQEMAGVVSAMERYNCASGQKQKALIARAESMGIKPYRVTMGEIWQGIERFRKEMPAREAPVEPKPGVNLEFYAGSVYVTGSNTEPVAIYQITNTPMNLNLMAGALYA